jgi:hypothetical protein
MVWQGKTTRRYSDAIRRYSTLLWRYWTKGKENSRNRIFFSFVNLFWKSGAIMKGEGQRVVLHVFGPKSLPWAAAGLSKSIILEKWSFSFSWVADAQWL